MLALIGTVAIVALFGLIITKRLSPLVALMHGRYRVLRDPATNGDHIARDNGAPLAHAADVELPLTATIVPGPAAGSNSTSGRALTLQAFETSISTEVQRTVPLARRN